MPAARARSGADALDVAVDLAVRVNVVEPEQRFTQDGGDGVFAQPLAVAQPVRLAQRAQHVVARALGHQRHDQPEVGLPPAERARAR